MNELGSKVAVAGCGYWGRNLVRNFAELDGLAAVCDPSPATVQEYAVKYDVPALGWEEVLRDDKIPAVAIAAPAVMHARLTGEALKAGKHVFVEKPLALDSIEAEELCALARACGKQLMVGHLLQYHPVFRKLKDLVDSGELGRLQYVYSNRLNLGKVRREENILWSFAPHDISMILSLVGESPDSVRATGGTFLHKAIADVTTTHLAFPSGIQAHIFVSWLHPFKEQKLVVVGERAMAVFDDGMPWEQKLAVYHHRIDWIDGRPQPAKADATYVDVEQDEPLRLECLHFLNAVADGTRPLTDGEEGLRVLRVLQAAEFDMAQQSGSVSMNAALRAPSAVGASRFPGVTVHETAVVDEPCQIGEGTKIWHFSHILGNVTVGKNCVFGQNVMVGPDVVVGDNCKIQNNVSLYKGVTLEDGVFCGPSCVFTNVNTPRAEIERKDEFRPTVVGRGATIGANATIVCGHDLGRYCMIAAGAVVTRSVPDHALMAGVPARQIGWVSHAGERLGADLVCPRTGDRYREMGPEKLEQISK
jgi:predicted dehydrogenase/acetyltransferase-like isoleucine patch superfamily enzyme